jgi:hypothetical protein
VLREERPLKIGVRHNEFDVIAFVQIQSLVSALGENVALAWSSDCATVSGPTFHDPAFSDDDIGIGLDVCLKCYVGIRGILLLGFNPHGHLGADGQTKSMLAPAENWLYVRIERAMEDRGELGFLCSKSLFDSTLARS